MQLFDTKSLRLQLFEEVHALAAKTQRFIDMFIKFEIGIEENTKQLESINTFCMHWKHELVWSLAMWLTMG